MPGNLSPSIAGALHVSEGSASMLVTASQLGYAVGLLFIVPAGDIVRRRPLLTGLLAFCAVMLAGCAAAPGLPILAAATALAAVTSVVVQMLVPYAATLASDAERGKVIGTLMGGLLIGILLSRTFAGVVAALAGWRAVYAIAAAAMAVTATMFAGGAIGSAAGAQAYEHWGWSGATLAAAAFPVLGLACWLAARRHEQAR